MLAHQKPVFGSCYQRSQIEHVFAGADKWPYSGMVNHLVDAGYVEGSFKH